MSQELMVKMEKNFQECAQKIFSKLSKEEHLTLQVAGERSQFLRFNGGKARQNGEVNDGMLSLRLISGGKNVTGTIPFVGDVALDVLSAQGEIEKLRSLAKAVPQDSFAVLPQKHPDTSYTTPGKILDPETATTKILSAFKGLDAAGYYAGGPSFRGVANTAGLFHWFGTESFFVDYSLYTPGEKSVKLTYSAREWDDAAFARQVEGGKLKLQHLDKAPRKVERGKYRTYLAPSAVGELIDMFSWFGISEGSLRRGESALIQMREGKKTFSPRFSLRENFGLGLTPRFNENGEVANETLSIVDCGKLVNTLVSSRTAKEYGLVGNAASGTETLRAAEVLPGQLDESEALKALGTGLYLSNLHYLNWSDVSNARVTGMTRYACFWVEGGEIVAPIQDLRWDESLYHCFGEGLEHLTKQTEFLPSTGTYNVRSLGGKLCPGALVNDFTFTL